MTLASAITAIEAWTISGCTALTYVQQQPPALSALPLTVLQFNYSYEGLRSIQVNFQKGAAVFQPSHYLLYCGVNQKDKTKLSSVVALVDLYLAEAAGDMLLGGALMEPLSILTSDFGSVPFMGVLYFGVRFTHRWVLKVG